MPNSLPPDFKRFSAEDLKPLGIAASVHEINALLEARFAEWAERQKEMFGCPEFDGDPEAAWRNRSYIGDTHRARLFGVEKLEGKDESR